MSFELVCSRLTSTGDLSRFSCFCACIQDSLKIEQEDRKTNEELDRMVLLAEQRREEERFLLEEQQREKMEKIKAVEGEIVPCHLQKCPQC